MDTYKRAVFVGPREIRFDELAIPEPGPRQALVKVRACALCTWEQRSYTGEERVYPLASGHEVAGELVKLGEGAVTRARIGQRVVASMLTRCGVCDACRRGLDNICDNGRLPGPDDDVAGPAGLAEYVLVDDTQLYRASEEVSFEELCLAEPVACVLRSLRKAAIGFGDNVVVVGAGLMGILHVILAKQAGARVFVSEPHGARAAFALEMGASALIDPAHHAFVQEVRDLTRGRGADAIFCAVSVGSVLEHAVEAVAKGGRVHVFASIHPRGTRISLDPNLFHSREIVLTGTMSQDRGDMRQGVALISGGMLDLKPLISLKVPLLQLEEGLRAAIRPDTYRVVVLP